MALSQRVTASRLSSEGCPGDSGKLQHESGVCSGSELQTNSLGCGIPGVHSSLFSDCLLLWARQAAWEGSVTRCLHFTVNFMLLSPRSHEELFWQLGRAGAPEQSSQALEVKFPASQLSSVCPMTLPATLPKLPGSKRAPVTFPK